MFSCSFTKKIGTVSIVHVKLQQQSQIAHKYNVHIHSKNIGTICVPTGGVHISVQYCEMLNLFSLHVIS